MIIKQFIILLGLISVSLLTNAQFYNGYTQDFGRNRIQHSEFNWSQYNLKEFNIFYYENGENHAIYTAKAAPAIISEMEDRFDYYLEEKIQFIIYNKFSDYKQSNIGIDDDDQNDIGGITRVRDSKVFLYYNGNHKDFEQQIRAGIANILIHRLMLGKNWKEVLKNSTLLTIPDWYIEGLVSYMAYHNDPLVEDKIRDGVVTGKYHQFNRLSGKDAVYAGHAIWAYIARTYGEKVIPNILYMSRLSRNVESGYLYVIGLSIKSLNKEAIAYYKEYYRDKEKYGDFPQGEVKLKIKSEKEITQVKTSPNEKYLAFATHEMGKHEIMLHDFSTGKTKKILSTGYQLDWVTNNHYPVLEWHPQGNSLAIVHNKKAENYLTFYTVIDKDKSTKPLLKIDQVVDMRYSPDGKSVVLSAVKNGQTDLYLYNPISNSQKQLTNDIYDDINPMFFTKNSIIFSSNRHDDTLRIEKNQPSLESSYDLFMLTIGVRENTLKRVTETPGINETMAIKKDTANFLFLTDASETIGRNIAYFDSVISHIDTIFHYRYITTTESHASYSRNILEHNYIPENDIMTQLFYKNGNYYISKGDLSGRVETTQQTPLNKEDKKKSLETPTNTPNSLEYQIIEKKTTPIPKINYNNYLFENEQPKALDNKVNKEDELVVEEPNIIDENVPTIIAPTENITKPFRLPTPVEYKQTFSALDIQTQLNFNYTTDMYQRYTGGFGYMNTKIGSETSVKLVDLLNDYEFEGGLRIALDWSIKEYYLSYTNRRKRLNKMYSVERYVNEFPVGDLRFKLEYNQTKMQLKYPINEVLSVRGVGSLRYDRAIELSTERGSLQSPTQAELMSGLKLEVVYDNTENIALNLRKGTRAKIFAETYNSIFYSAMTEGTSTGDSSLIQPTYSYKPDMVILGFDLRKYIEINRGIVWANRLAASTSFGEQKLLYYMGGVDNKVHFGDKARFNYNLPVADGQNYTYQTLATNMRGFLQNSRNGNNFALFSSELRVPVFKFFATKPLKSDFLKNFQTVIFTDIGTAWTGKNPYSDDNYFNTTVVQSGNVKVILRNQDEPLIAGYGFGVRSRVLGYFMKWDVAWGVEDGRINKPQTYLSVGLDF